MKKERSFQRKLLPIILLLAAVPLFLFSILALVSLRGILVDRYEEQVDSDLAQSEKLMDITLERYRTLLDEAAADGDLLAAAERAAQGQELTGGENEKINGCLEQMVRQSSGAAGAALLLCFLSGAKKRVAAIVLINSLIGAAVAFIPMFFGHFLPETLFLTP